MVDIAKALTGFTSINTKDNFDWFFVSGELYKGLWAGVITTCGMMLYKLYFDATSLTKLDVFIIALISGAVAFLVFILIMASFIFLGFMKLSPAQKSISWTVNPSELILEDKSGNKITTPWAQVKNVKVTRKGTVVFYKPIGSRWIPVRLMDPMQVAELFKNYQKNQSVS